MSRTDRSRSRYLKAVSGGYADEYVGTTFIARRFTQGAKSVSYEHCNDSVGTQPYEDSFLGVRNTSTPTIRATGYKPIAAGHYYVYDLALYGPSYTYLVDLPITFGVPWLKYGSWDAMAADAVGNINPNKATLDLPVSLFELRELPGLLKETGLLLLKKLPFLKGSAKAQLMYQFGWKPLIRDVLTLLDFTDAVAAREQLLRDMSRGKKRFKRRLGTASTAWTNIPGKPSGVPAFDAYAQIVSTEPHINVPCTAKQTYWFSCRASLDVPLTEREIRTGAWRSMLGVDGIHAESVWEALPWTWLIDWFSSTGDILAAYRGGYSWSFDSLNLMKRTEYMAKCYFTNVPTGYMSINLLNPTVVATHKHRMPKGYVNPIPLFYVPVLTGRQMDILSALAVIKL